MSRLSFNKVQYVPFLKGKMGEFGALRELDPIVRSSILPLIDVLRIKISGPERKPVEPLEKHLDRVLKHFSKLWPSGDSPSRQRERYSRVCP